MLESVLSIVTSQKKEVKETIPVDVFEEGNFLWVEAELPGTPKENITIDQSPYSLKISAEIPSLKKHAKDIERTHGYVERILRFDTPIKVEESSAEYKDGILKIKLVKRKKLSYSKLEVK
jgi:HSP20 family molecular chaperone IbpA